MQFLKILTFLSLALLSNSVMAEFASSKAEAAKLAQQQVSGKVLKVEQRGDQYKVKILQISGRVVSVMINKKEEKKEQGNAS